MTRSVLATALLLFASLVPAMGASIEEDGRDRAFAALEIPEGPLYVGQQFEIGLEIGWETAWFEAHGVPLFLRSTDVPVQVDGSWLGEIQGTVAVEVPPGPTSRQERSHLATLAVGEQVLSAVRSPGPTRKRDGRSFSTVFLRRTLAATQPGTITIPAPSVRWAWSSRFEDDALGGRRALERREESATGAEGSIEVLPVPTEGRPATWAGAIGRYSIHASVSATEVELGGSIRLVVRISGVGNLSRIERPGPAEIAGFHVLGLLDDRGRSTRTLTYDLSPVDEKTREVPMLPIAYLDPGPPARWCEEWTAPIPIRAKPASNPGAVPPVAPTASPPAPEPGGGDLAVAIGGAAVVLMGAGVAVWLARRGRTANEAVADPAAERVVAAAAALRAAAASTRADLGSALAEFLAAGLGVPAAAAIGPDLAARLVAAGVPEARAREAASLLEALVAARYGGAIPADAPAAAAAIARDLEPIFAARYLGFPNTRA